MDLRARWRRLDAEHWVHVAGMLTTALLVIAALAAVLLAPFAGVALAALAALSGWLTSAWRRERPWAWWVWTIGSAASFVTALDDVLAGQAGDVVSLLLAGVMLGLLSHPDSRARVETESVLPR